ncbi:DNA methyltransferase, partial [Corynebacterium mendelii]
IETEIIAAIYEREGLTTGALDVTLDQRLSIGQFYGFEINWWPARIAETAMFLVDHQANQHLAARIGLAPERLPIKVTAHIYHCNALRKPWETTIPRAVGSTYIFGNPPFLGHDPRTDEQSQELRDAWRMKNISRLDYVTAWYAKSLDFFKDRAGSFAFVSTNSITQGDQVQRLFKAIFAAGWKIKFAHRTFEWDSDAPDKAAVHVVIVGFTREETFKPQLWRYETVKSDPTPLKVATGINGYLIDAPNVIVTTRSKSLNPIIPKASFGSVPRDNGSLVVTGKDIEAFRADPVAAKYIRSYLGARELLHKKERWCLWLVDLDPEDLRRSAILKERVEGCRKFRESSPSEQANEAASTPHLFWWRAQPETNYVFIPSSVSERRKYFVAVHLSPDVIASNAAYTAVDPDGLLFGLLSSSMFITWQKAVGGRLKSDLRFSSVSWHTFPVPELTDAQRQEIIAGGKAVLEARALHPERSLADQYEPLAMDPDLLRAHARLDRVVDKAMGASRKLTTEEQRLEVLFKNYADLTRD